jgi:transposase-like protein
VAKLKKEVVDMLLKDHKAGYSIAEVAERTGVHRNTIAKRLAEVARTDNTVGAKHRRDAVLAAVADVTLVAPCMTCGKLVPVVLTQPNAFIASQPVGYVVLCRCGAVNELAVKGRRAEFDAWLAQQR